jgi:hypothetical protein
VLSVSFFLFFTYGVSSYWWHFCLEYFFVLLSDKDIYGMEIIFVEWMLGLDMNS